MTSKRIKKYLFFDGGTQYIEKLSHTAGRLTDVGQPTQMSSHPPYSPPKADHLSHKRGLKYKIWQPGFYDFNILYEEKFVEKLEYIHNNQFHDKRIKDPENYLYSSMMFYEKEKGALKIDFV